MRQFIAMATSNGDYLLQQRNIHHAVGVGTAGQREEEFVRQLRLKDEMIGLQEEEIHTLRSRVITLEREIGVLWERLGTMGEEKKEQNTKMSLLQEEASRSLNGMVAAKREKKREEAGNKEMREQLEMQVSMQAEELGHLRELLLEETRAHREDIEVSRRRANAQLQKLKLQLERAKSLGTLSTSQPSLNPAQYSTLPPLSPGLLGFPRRQQARPPLQHTASYDIPPSYQESVEQVTLPSPTYQRAPALFHTGVSAFHDTLCYFSSFMTTQIHVYDTAEGAWRILPRCPVTNFGLEVVNGKLTIIGGRLVKQPSLCSSRLLSLVARGDSGESEKEWTSTLPSMALARASPATASNGRLVIVAGGEVGDHKTFIADLEVLDVETGLWSQLSSSPLGNYSWLSAVICRDQLYLLEGSGAREKDKIHVLHMGALVEFLQDLAGQSRGGGGGGGRKTGLPWRQIKPPPASNTTCVCAKGRLVVVGGIEAGGKTTNQIWAYDKSGGVWKSIGNLKSPRYRTLVSVTATGSLLVIGGLTKTKFTDHVEIFDAF